MIGDKQGVADAIFSYWTAIGNHGQWVHNALLQIVTTPKQWEETVKALKNFQEAVHSVEELERDGWQAWAERRHLSVSGRGSFYTCGVECSPNCEEPKCNSRLAPEPYVKFMPKRNKHLTVSEM